MLAGWKILTLLTPRRAPASRADGSTRDHEVARGLHRRRAMNIRGAALMLVMTTTAGVAAADGPQRREEPSEYDRDPPNRVTGVMEATLGLFVAFGGSLTYERRVYHDLGVLVRVGYARGAALASEDDEKPLSQLGYANVGGRYYMGRFYLHSDLGVASVRHGGYVHDPGGIDQTIHPIEYFTFPNLSAGLGGKPNGAIDIGISMIFPLVGVQVHLGVDFSQF